MRSSTSTCATTLISGSKRKQPDDGELNDGYADVVRAKAGKQMKSITELDTRLACPFFKNDLAQHQDCVKAAYQTWAHVKQHLRRKHYHQMACRSPSSHELPQTGRHENVKSPCRCTSEETYRHEKIGDAKMRLIEEKTKPRHMTDAERWNAAWDIIFPHARTPATPYARDLIDELVDYFIRRISKRPRSFDDELVDDKLVTSPTASEAVASRFIDLLRDEGEFVKPCRHGHPQQEVNADAMRATPSRTNEPTHNCIPVSASADSFAPQSPGTGAINNTGTAYQNALSIYDEESMVQECLFLDPDLWEVLGGDVLCGRS
ncbi:hypothetical protein K456DRAFT_1758911 [Colletotrichum gloeosporioides 23]|nr:hypothetical protein K456DRAFT_1758911 [Colletotrichum gloeosporioides 23]